MTNNPLMEGEKDVLFIQGTFRDVLVKVRDMVYSGYELLTHPLFASLGMMFSPYRTVILGEKLERPSEEMCLMAENSLQSYEQATAMRNAKDQYNQDYAFLDKSLYESALEELASIRQVSL